MDEQGRQLILWLESRAAERDRGFQRWAEEREREFQRRAADRDREFTRFLDRLDARAEARWSKIDAKLDDVLAEGRAQRAALFRMLDRLDGGGGAAPA